jgi:hypothetical protein
VETRPSTKIYDAEGEMRKTKNAWTAPEEIVKTVTELVAAVARVRRRLEGSGRFLCLRSAIIPSTRNIARHGICCESQSLTETFRLARRNSPVRHFFLLFLRFPQGMLVLHSLCTTPHEISVADVL